MAESPISASGHVTEIIINVQAEVQQGVGAPQPHAQAGGDAGERGPRGGAAGAADGGARAPGDHEGLPAAGGGPLRTPPQLCVHRPSTPALYSTAQRSGFFVVQAEILCPLGAFVGIPGSRTKQ